MPSEASQQLPVQFLIYAAVFRLAVTAAGVASIVFGYKLLSRAGEKRRTADGSFVASVGQTQLALKNLAPGTMFAAFGMLLVGIMVYQGMPELKQNTGTGELVLRGPATAPADDFGSLARKAVALQQAGDALAATEAYEQALDLLATPANNLAELYLQQNRAAEALALSRYAVDLRPFRAEFLDTLSTAYERAGDHAAALKVAERAASFDERYRERLGLLKSKGIQ